MTTRTLSIRTPCRAVEFLPTGLPALIASERIRLHADERARMIARQAPGSWEGNPATITWENIPVGGDTRYLIALFSVVARCYRWLGDRGAPAEFLDFCARANSVRTR